jgi:hypothetical protein
LVKLALEGGRRIIASQGRKRNQKEPFSSELVKNLVQTYGDSENLLNLRCLIICLLGFSGFFRISEFLEVKIGDIVFQVDGIKINIEKSKTDQLRGVMRSYCKNIF